MKPFTPAFLEESPAGRRPLPNHLSTPGRAGAGRPTPPGQGPPPLPHGLLQLATQPCQGAPHLWALSTASPQDSPKGPLAKALSASGPPAAWRNSTPGMPRQPGNQEAGKSSQMLSGATREPGRVPHAFPRQSSGEVTARRGLRAGAGAQMAQLAPDGRAQLPLATQEAMSGPPYRQEGRGTRRPRELSKVTWPAGGLLTVTLCPLGLLSPRLPQGDHHW